jgi:hypothetical protein
MTRLSPRVLALSTALLGAACTGTIADTPDEGAPGAPDPASPSPPSSSPPVSGDPGRGAAAAPGATGAAPAAPAGAAPRCGHVAQRLYRLTPRQLRRTLAALFGARSVGPELEADLSHAIPASRPYGNAEAVLSLSSSFLETYLGAVRPLATAAAENAGDLHPCFKGGVTKDCVTSFVAEFGARAWRRPWQPEEVQAYVSFYEGLAPKVTPVRALALTLRRMLAAPDFLFRSELGEPAGAPGLFQLTSAEVASALAYALTDAPPDAELAELGRRGALRERAAIETEARRLLAQPQTSAGIFSFFADFLEETAEGHPDHPEQARRFLQHALWNDKGTLGHLLTADYTFVNPALQKHYAWAALPAVKDWQRLTPPAAEGRSGLLGAGTWLSRHHNRSARGRFIKDWMLCSKIPDPPDNAPTDLEEELKKLRAELGRPVSEEEALASHMSNPACSSCHVLIDPLGKPLARFDKRGVWRAADPATKKPIDTTAQLIATGEIDGPVADPLALGRALGAAKSVSHCFAQQVYHYVVGRSVDDDAAACHVDALGESFHRAGGDVRQLFVDIVASDSFRVRRAFGRR